MNNWRRLSVMETFIFNQHVWLLTKDLNPLQNTRVQVLDLSDVDYWGHFIVVWVSVSRRLINYLMS